MAKKRKADKKKTKGRPSDYTPKIAEEICIAIATSNKGLKKLCEEHQHWPNYDTVFMWRVKNADFAEKYLLAKKHQVEVLIDEVIEIADDTTRDDKITENGVVPNSEWINRSRIRIDTRKWIACKLVPRLYGDKVTNEMTGPDGKPIQHEVASETKLTVDLIDQRIKDMSEKVREKK